MNDVLTEAYARVEAVRSAIRSTHRGRHAGDFSHKAAAKRARLWRLFEQASVDVWQARRDARERDLA
jgi:uncharacterized protein (DUF2384 family)